MKNLEQTLAKSLLNQYEFCQRMWRENAIDYDYLQGQKVAVMSIAKSIWGQDITGQIPLEFLSNLEKIANSEPQANLVEVSRFEAFAMFKDYGVRAVNARHEGLEGLAETYSERSDKWLDIATKIEQSNADGFNKDLMHI